MDDSIVQGRTGPEIVQMAQGVGALKVSFVPPILLSAFPTFMVLISQQERS